MISKNKTRIIVTLENQSCAFLEFLSENLGKTKSEIVNALLIQYSEWYLSGGINKDEK